MKFKNIFIINNRINENVKVISSYIQYKIGSNKENFNKNNIAKEIAELQKTNDGAFWIGINIQNSNEIILEINKHKEIHLHLNDEHNTYYSTKLNEWNEIENCFQLLLKGKVQEIEMIMIENNTIKTGKNLMRKPHWI